MNESIRNVLTSTVTIFGTVAILAQALIDELGDSIVDTGWAVGLARLVAVSAAAVATIRRVTPVAETERGLS